MKPTNSETISEAASASLTTTNVVLSTLLANLPIGILVEDSSREIIAANPALCEILHVATDPAALIGRDCSRAAADLQGKFVDSERFLARIETILERRDPVFGEQLALEDGRTLERTYIPYALPDGEANLWLYQDVTDRRERERALERQNERLEEFLAVVSHDLRNPLNVASANLELATDEYDSDRLDAASDALDRMDSLIDDLLVLAREDEAIGTREPVNIGELSRECWSYVESTEATLTVAVDRTARADRSRLAQVFENLFRNAIEHGGRDVDITVGTVPGGFYVEDDGRGVPAAKRGRIFDGTYSTSGDGTGLGLRIVEMIVDAHGWEIALAETDATGARFEITGVQFLD